MNIHPSRRCVLALLAACAASPAPAQPGLRRPLRLIVPAPAGGTADFVARALTQALHTTAGLTAVIDNRPGVAGAVATEVLLSAPRDGSTLLLSPNSLVTEVPYTIKPRYDPFKDLVPLVELASIGIVLVADADLSVRTLQEMLDYVKARPGQVTYASFGPGTISHVKGLQFCRAAGLDMQHVGYKGSPPALLDVVGGRVPFMFDGITTSAPHVRAQRLRALAVTSPRRSPLLPDVPTFAELGYGDLTQTVAMTLFATPEVPAAAAAQLRRQVLDALRSPELLAAFTTAGLEVAAQQQTTDDLRRAMRREHERTGRILDSIGHTPAS
ncbi:tripartite tricarboxylate transporter substrate binding protein [Ramlibacter henchirensis]|uniref:Tripartite tricarboxylate transporter substrate binding protein n=1 Tax=Ramlibacter henchirensis TaxID=204072 RepID=A0A4Z0C3J5_9BURK|nr:tripartite tricarboxylate transporter substrate binding protein [Ramlibacter henchirensis]TFZ05502.1 tripartite tricarboxylate transporter substrate binding protein [Ramlibacter henchirensis]